MTCNATCGRLCCAQASEREEWQQQLKSLEHHVHTTAAQQLQAERERAEERLAYEELQGTLANERRLHQEERHQLVSRIEALQVQSRQGVVSAVCRSSVSAVCQLMGCLCDMP